MKNAGRWLLLAGLLSVLMTGCTDMRQSLVLDTRPSVTPTVSMTPMEDEALTPTPTLTPMPTPTPTLTPIPTAAPRKVGNKSAAAGSVTVANKTGKRFRNLQIRTGEGEDWGRNLIPADSSILPDEIFQLYYPASGGSYELRLIDTDRQEYIMYTQPLNDMVNASLQLDGAQDAFFAYTSKAYGTQSDTSGYSYTEYYSGSYASLGGGSSNQPSYNRSEDEASDEEDWDYTDSYDQYDEDNDSQGGFVIYSESTYDSGADNSGGDRQENNEEWDYVG